MKAFLFYIVCILLLVSPSAHGQYSAFRSECPLPQIDSILFKYNINEDFIKTFHFDHIVSSEISPLLIKNNFQKHPSNISVKDLITFKQKDFVIKAGRIKADDAYTISLGVIQNCFFC